MRITFGKVKKIKTKAGRATPPARTPSAETVPVSIDSFFKTSLDTYRYSSPNDALKKLALYDPDVSNALFAYMANCNTQWYPVVRKMDGTIDESGYKKLIKLLNQWNFYYDPAGNWDHYNFIDSVINNLVKTTMVRGGICAELILDTARQPVNLVMIDPVRVSFKQKKASIYTPTMKDPKTNKDVDLNIPTFFYETLIPENEDPYSYSPIVSVLEIIFFSLDVIRDLNKVLKASGYPKYDVKILYEILKKNTPMSVRMDEEKWKTFVETKFDEIKAAVRQQKPEDAFVHFDYAEIDRLESKSGAVVDFRPIIQILDQRVSSALKSMPAILGRTVTGSGATDDKTEAMLYVKNVKMIQKFVASFLSKVFTLILRLNGSKSFAEFKFTKVSLRSDEEVENHRKMLQSRMIEAVKLGWVTDAEAAFEIYHKPPAQESGIFGRYEEFEIKNNDLTQDPLAFGTDPSTSGDGGSGRPRTTTNTDVVDAGGTPSQTGEVTGG